jgi:ribosome-interacting GTPase 1
VPANLTLQYLQAEERFKAAKTNDEKIACLEEMIRELPKHKHTEKMFADLKTRLSKLRKGDEKKGPSGPSRHTEGYAIKPEGMGQVVVLGAPNSGKSALVGAFTNAAVEVTDYPFTTRRPSPGMMSFEDVRIQLVDTPSLSPEFQDPFLMPFVRNADAAVVTVDLSSPDFLDQAGWVESALDEAGMRLVADAVERVGRHESPRPLPAFLAATKADHPDAEVALELLREVAGDRLPLVTVSIEDPASLDRFRRACFDRFGRVRVYSKQPGKEAERDAPFLVPAGANVLDFAGRVHRDLRERFSFARVWGPGKFDGQRVARDYAVEDGDVIELHTL